MRILIIEDEERLAKNISKYLQENALFAVDISTDGEDGLHMAQSGSYDMVILDLMLPKIDGWSILRQLREKGDRTPILILTARDRTDDIVRGLDQGCDDYLTKPFDMQELMARCRALIRRDSDHPEPVIEAGEVLINTSTKEITFRGKKEVLPAMEYRLLEYLAIHAGKVVSKEEILDHLYDHNSEIYSNVVEVYISLLRKKFGTEMIRTVRRHGYVLEGKER